MRAASLKAGMIRLTSFMDPRSSSSARDGPRDEPECDAQIQRADRHAKRKEEPGVNVEHASQLGNDLIECADVLVANDRRVVHAKSSPEQPLGGHLARDRIGETPLAGQHDIEASVPLEQAPD